MKRALLAGLLVALLAVSTTGCAGKAAKFPAKPITIIVPWGAGGATDILARSVAEVGKRYFPQPVVVVNKPGGAGTIAATEVAKATPDGYTILLGAVALFTVQPYIKDVGYKLDDFEGVIGLSHEPIFLAVRSGSPWKSVNDLVEDFRRSGKEVVFGHPGVGTINHLATEALLLSAGLRGKAVPYQSGTEALAALLGHHVDVVSQHAPELAGQYEAKGIRILGVYSPDRDEAWPEVPTMKEQGYDLDYAVWKFLMVPKGTPREVIQVLHDGFKKVLEDPEYVQLIKTKVKMPIQYVPSAEIKNRLREQQGRHAALLKQLGLTNQAKLREAGRASLVDGLARPLVMLKEVSCNANRYR